MNALIDWDDVENWGGHVHHATTDDLGHGRHSEGMSGLSDKAACPYSHTHGNPFRYCECGWMETPSTSTEDAQAAEKVALTDTDATLTEAARERLTTEVIAAPDAEANVVRRIVNAWDCCGTCAGGVYASAVRAAVEQERAAPTWRRRLVTENPQEFLMRTLSKAQWDVVADCLRVEVAEALDAAKAQAWDDGRRFGQTHWATNYAPEVPGKSDPNPHRARLLPAQEES